jgi:nitroimidazol reductase NimA-like FMN-containing flavoprotein (pyridoxamine 5'-phosphate oxidase superfamily)
MSIRLDTVNVDSELEVLSPEECISLAATMPIGRIVFTDRALPAVQPVNFLIEDGSVIIRTVEGSKLAAATRNAIVAFEIDEFDRLSQAGWSVTLVGRAQSVRDPAEAARLARLPLYTWAPGLRDRFIRIHPEHISGRRVPASVRANGSCRQTNGTGSAGRRNGRAS